MGNQSESQTRDPVRDPVATPSYLLMADEEFLPRYLRHDRLQQLKSDPVSVDQAITQANRIDMIRAEMQWDELDVRVAGGVAVIPINGVIEYKMTVWGWLFGGTSCQGITRALQQAIADQEITRVVFDVDSPGGTYEGIPETAATIFAARSEIDTVAIANPLAASAAIRLATAAGRFTVLGSGMAGSVGTVIHLQTWARAFEEMGVDNRILRAPAGKMQGNIFEPIDDDYAAYLQGWVDRLTAEFHSELAKHRDTSVGAVRSDFGGGRLLLASDAVSAGLCDAISTIEKEISRGNRRSSGRRRQEEAPHQLATGSKRRALTAASLPRGGG